MSITATAPAAAHGELDCVDAESILHATTHENTDLRARLTTALEAQDRAEHEIETLRLESARLRALLEDVGQKNADLASERDDLHAQVKFLHEELNAVEGDAVPEGTLLFAALPRSEMVAEYRRISRVRRGPLPPVITEAIDAASEQIVDTMIAAGQEALSSIVRREVRRRRRAQSRR